MKSFPLSLSKDAKEWWINKGYGNISTWDELVKKFFKKIYPLSCASNYDNKCDDDEEGRDPLEFIPWRNSKFKDHKQVDETTKRTLLYTWIEIRKEEELLNEESNEGICRVDKFKVIKYTIGGNEEFLAICTRECDSWARTVNGVSSFTIIDDDDMTKDVVLGMKFYKKYASCQMIMKKLVLGDKNNTAEIEFALVFQSLIQDLAETMICHQALSWEPTVSPLNDNEIDFRISFDESDDEDYTIIYDENSFSYKIISVDNLKTDLENDKVNIPLFPSPEPDVSYFNDLDFFKDFENEIPAIVYNDALTSKSDFLTEHILRDRNWKLRFEHSAKSGRLLAGIHGLFSGRNCCLVRRITCGYPWPELEGKRFGMIQERFRSSAWCLRDRMSTPTQVLVEGSDGDNIQVELKCWDHTLYQYRGVDSDVDMRCTSNANISSSSSSFKLKMSPSQEQHERGAQMPGFHAVSNFQSVNMRVLDVEVQMPDANMQQ
ncbi:hypothetical protein Tco_1328631 [Tanacetum coccineum]